MWEQNVSGRGGLAVGRGKKPDWPESSLSSPPGPAPPSPLATAADTCLNMSTWSTPQFCLKGPSPVHPALSGFSLKDREILVELGGGELSMNCPSSQDLCDVRVCVRERGKE